MSEGKCTQMISDQLNIFSQSKHTHVILEQERKFPQTLKVHEALTMSLLVNRYSGLLLIKRKKKSTRHLFFYGLVVLYISGYESFIYYVYCK